MHPTITMAHNADTSGPDYGLTIPEILRLHAARRPAAHAIVCRDCIVTYQELAAKADALARLFMECGVGKGDRIGLLMDKTPEAMLAYLGASASGGVFFPLDPHHPPATLRAAMELNRPAALVVSRPHLPLLARAEYPIPDHALLVIGHEPGDPGRPFGDLDRFLSLPGVPDVALDLDDPVYLNMTSGTTGTPKGAITTHRNISANTQGANEAFGFTADDVHLCMFPTFVHPHELYARPVYLGGTIAMVDNIHPKAISKALARFKVTTLMAVASIYETLVRLDRTDFYQTRSLRIPESGGMHAPATLVHQFRERFGVPIFPVWGSTEATGIAFATPPTSDLSGYRPGAMGMPCPGYKIRVVTEDGRDAATGEPGELHLSGPGVVGGYFNATDEQNGNFRDGWFATGDMVQFDVDGYFYFQARLAGLMKVGGMKVFPVEIEECLRAHPDIVEVAVVGVDDGLRGEVPHAFVVARDGSDLSRTAVRKYCETHLHRYKVPRMIRFLDELPKTPGGKVAWKKLSSA